MRLAGKTAVITGGSSGIGLASARAFLREGARVVILGRDTAKPGGAVAGLGDGVSGIEADVARTQTLAAAMTEAGRRRGGIDILFANAGVSDTPALADLTAQAFDDFMAVNVRGAVFSVVHALREGASIILTGSVAARKGWPGDAVYAASKGAIRSFGRTPTVSEEMLARRIRVNVVTPGTTRTPLTRAAASDPAAHQWVAERIPMKRWGEAEEVAEAVLFLASDASSYTTGAEITVDGGLAHV